MKPGRKVAGSVIAGMVLLAGLSGCSQNKDGRSALLPVSQNNNVAAPIRLGGQKKETSSGLSVRGHVSPAVARRAIENYRVNKKAKRGPYKYAAADLNGDGQAEILVYYTGEGWCGRTGCSLVVLSPISDQAYESISIVRRVKTPVIISPESTQGWRDIHIRTGLADWPKSHKVVLKFSGRGYPGNAVLLTPLPRRTKIEGEEIFGSPTPEEIEFMKLAASRSQ